MQIDRHVEAPRHQVETFRVELVHEAVIAARLKDLQAGLHAGRDMAVDPREAAPHPGRLRAIRVRLGHAIVALGAFVEGPSDCPDAPVARRPA